MRKTAAVSYFWRLLCRKAGDYFKMWYYLPFVRQNCIPVNLTIVGAPAIVIIY